MARLLGYLFLRGEPTEELAKIGAAVVDNLGLLFAPAAVGVIACVHLLALLVPPLTGLGWIRIRQLTPSERRRNFTNGDRKCPNLRKPTFRSLAPAIKNTPFGR